MGRVYDEIKAPVRAFIEAQHMFFVSTAPLSAEGHVNLSPKALDAFRVLGPREVAYVDFNGSGVETIAHIRENGRLTIMFCAFEGNPNIVRLYGMARVVLPADEDFAALLAHFTPKLEVRSIVVLSISRVADSCGYAVPHYEYVGQRDQLIKWSNKKDAEALAAYRAEKNSHSIDGLPGIRH